MAVDSSTSGHESEAQQSEPGAKKRAIADTEREAASSNTQRRAAFSDPSEATETSPPTTAVDEPAMAMAPPVTIADAHTPTSVCGRAILACCLDIRFRARLVAHSRRRPSKNPTSGLNGNEGELRLLRFPLVMTAPAMDGHGADTTARTTGGPPASAAGIGTGMRAGARIEVPGPGDRTAAPTAAATPGGRAVLPVATVGADNLRGAHCDEHFHHSDTGLLPGLSLPGAAMCHCSFAADQRSRRWRRWLQWVQRG